MDAEGEMAWEAPGTTTLISIMMIMMITETARTALKIMGTMWILRKEHRELRLVFSGLVWFGFLLAK